MLLISLSLLVPLAGRSDLLFLVLPVLAFFGIFLAVYLARKRSKQH
ncbi:MAG TPA: hypothetical protein VEQ66_00560 [Propionibacteriaceae bacterium]|nr:hypothetical protein [Propionibacteriaceae bacterium]